MIPDANLSAAQFGLNGPLGSYGNPVATGAGTGGVSVGMDQAASTSAF